MSSPNPYTENASSMIKRMRGDIYTLLEILEISRITPFEVNQIDDVIERIKSHNEDLRILVGRELS